MAKKDYYFRSADKSSSVHATIWRPADKPRAVLQLVHGMVEHIDRYDEFARFMNDHGFVVAGHDHIGHGLTAESVDQLGIMNTDNAHVTMVEDIYSNYRLLKEEYSDIPYFILGHSMGSYMVRMFLSEKSARLGGLSGAIIMGTGTESDLAINAGLLLIRIVTAFKGRDYRSKFINDLTQGSAYKQFDTTGEDPANSWLSKNVENVCEYNASPYCTFKFTLGGMKGLVSATRYDNKVSNIKKIRHDLPVLFVSGSDDPVGNMGKGVYQAAVKFKHAGLTDVTVKLFEGDRHEILNELDRELVYKYILTWIERVMEK